MTGTYTGIGIVLCRRYSGHVARSLARSLQVPWEALRALLGQSVYGGRVDSVFDQQVLESFVLALFQASSFDLNFPLCRSVSRELSHGICCVSSPFSTCSVLVFMMVCMMIFVVMMRVMMVMMVMIMTL